MRRRRLAGLAILGIALLLGCVPESEQPLSPAASATLDSRILGTWIGRGEDGEDPVWLHFAGSGPSSMEIALIVPEPGKGVEASFYKMHSTWIGSHTFMNLKSTIPKGNIPLKVPEEMKYPNPGGYLLVKYALSKEGILKIWLMTDAVSDAIEAGKIRGEARKDQYSSDIRITDTSGNISRFLETAPHERIFKLFLVCRRIDEKPPSGEYFKNE